VQALGDKIGKDIEQQGCQQDGDEGSARVIRKVSLRNWMMSWRREPPMVLMRR